MEYYQDYQEYQEQYNTRKLHKLLDFQVNYQETADLILSSEGWMKMFLDELKSKIFLQSLNSYFTKTFQDKNNTLNLIQKLLATEKSEYKLLYQNGCKAAIDLMIGKRKFRFLLMSCDDKQWRIDQIGELETVVQQLLTNMISTEYGTTGKSIGKITMTPQKQVISVKGKLSNLESYANKKLGIHIHEFGVLSPSCSDCGGHFNPTISFHGGTQSSPRHVGDLGNILVDRNGIADIDINIPYYDIIQFAGRSIVLHNQEDDLGKGSNNDSLRTGNSGKRIACGIIGIAK